MDFEFLSVIGRYAPDGYGLSDNGRHGNFGIDFRPRPMSIQQLSEQISHQQDIMGGLNDYGILDQKRMSDQEFQFTRQDIENGMNHVPQSSAERILIDTIQHTINKGSEFLQREAVSMARGMYETFARKCPRSNWNGVPETIYTDQVPDHVTGQITQTVSQSLSNTLMDHADNLIRKFGRDVGRQIGGVDYYPNSKGYESIDHFLSSYALKSSGKPFDEEKAEQDVMTMINYLIERKAKEILLKGGKQISSEKLMAMLTDFILAMSKTASIATRLAVEKGLQKEGTANDFVPRQSTEEIVEMLNQ